MSLEKANGFLLFSIRDRTSQNGHPTLEHEMKRNLEDIMLAIGEKTNQFGLVPGPISLYRTMMSTRRCS